MNQDFEHYNDDDEEFISKSQIKREMEELQVLGEKLMTLNHSQLEKVPLDDVMMAAIEESKRIKSHEARRRHAQYVGRLMRKKNHEEIRIAVSRLDSSSEEFARFNQQIERWRERLMNDKDALSDFINQFPSTNIQHLRQLVRNATQEANKKPDINTARKKLFQELKEICFESHNID